MPPEIQAFLEFLAEIGPRLFDLFKAGGRDAVLEALDATLVAIRQKTDDDLRKKHAGDPP